MECLAIWKSYKTKTRAELKRQPTITIPHANTIKGSHRFGLRYFRTRLLGTFQKSVHVYQLEENRPYLE